jgi:hypothetical protein
MEGSARILASLRSRSRSEDLAIATNLWSSIPMRPLAALLL